MENKSVEGKDVTAIVDRLYGSLYGFAMSLTKSESDAADLVQQTFLALSQRLHEIRDFSKIKYWLFTTLRRNFLMKVRHRQKHPEVEFLLDVHDLPTGDAEVPGTFDPGTVREALLKINETYRTALELFYLGRLSYRKIGESLQIPIGTVMSRLSRGRAQLKSSLSTSYYDDGERQGMWKSDFSRSLAFQGKESTSESTRRC